ncbi:MAG: hypothetical protein WCD35_00215, partial [Mycobacteriales bacterium]
MTDTPAGTPAAAPGGPVSDRMQALLSRAVEEQVSEQRAVSTVLADLRTQVAGLADSVRSAASDAAVERLEGTVSTVVSDLRTSTALLGQRIEALAQRVDAVASQTAAPTEQAAVRLAALSAELGAHGEAVERLQTALDALSAFPQALGSLQKDVAGLHDRLQPLAQVRADVGDLGARTSGALEALRPQLAALQSKVEAIGVVPDPERSRDAVVDALVDALGGRLDQLVEAAERPVVGPEALRSDLGDLRVALDSATGERLDALRAGLGAVEERLGEVGQRVADVGDAAGGVPALATDLTRLSGRVEELHALRDQVAALADGVQELRDDSSGTTLTLGLAALRDDVEQLSERVAQAASPPVEEVAALVSQRVADRLVETLAPRIADVVLTRVSAALVAQLGDALAPRLRSDTELVVRAAGADSERRVLAHVDEAVLALAEALLRRRRGGRPVLPTAESEPAGAGGDEAELLPGGVEAPAPEVAQHVEEPQPPAQVAPAAAEVPAAVPAEPIEDVL